MMDKGCVKMSDMVDEAKVEKFLQGSKKGLTFRDFIMFVDKYLGGLDNLPFDFRNKTNWRVLESLQFVDKRINIKLDGCKVNKYNDYVLNLVNGENKKLRVRVFLKNQTGKHNFWSVKVI